VAGGALGWAWRVARRDRTSSNPGSKNMQAVYLYDLGKADLLNNRNEQQLLDAAKWFEQAIDLDTNFARAYVGLASACRQLNVLYELGGDWDRKAFEAAGRAIALNPRLAEAYVARGALYFTPFKHWDAQRDVADQQFALKLDPKAKSARFQKAFVFYHYGLFEEALAEVRQELKNYPADRGPRWLEGRTLCALGRCDEGREVFDSVPDESFPHLRMAGYCKALAYMSCGDPHKAAALLDRLLGLKELTEDPLLISVQAILAAGAGHRQDAEQKITLASLGERRFIHFHHVAYNIGSAYALLGKNAEAISWLRKSMDDGNPCYPFLRDDPNLKALRNDAAFAQFLEEEHKRYESNKAMLLGR
jgi:tetratricopeptide (TPR) repeat protein